MPKYTFSRRTLIIYCLVRLERLNLTVYIVSSTYSSSSFSIIKRLISLIASIAASFIISSTISIALDNHYDDTSNSNWEALSLLPNPVFFWVREFLATASTTALYILLYYRRTIKIYSSKLLYSTLILRIFIRIELL